MKKKLIALSLIAVCLSLLAYGTVAFFSTKETAHNVITSGNVGIELREWADKEAGIAFPEDGENGVMPGTTVNKWVEVANTGSGDVWVRVQLLVDIHPQNMAARAALDPSAIHLQTNNKDWALGADGYYYYNAKLQPGQVTAPVLTTVTFDAEMGNEYQNCVADVQVTAFAVQAANNGATVADAAGWPANP